jgi:DNA-binding NtrC family response regulator
MRKGNLLIVDDEELIVDNLKITLTEHADNIFIAYNGIEALEVLKDQEVHCIICDINMPNMNGVEFIKEVRAKKLDIPFIFYTGHGNLDLMQEAARYGAFDFLDKPNLDGLIDVITLGLKKGFCREGENAQDWEVIKTEFAKMLKEL